MNSYTDAHADPLRQLHAVGLAWGALSVIVGVVIMVIGITS